MSYKRINNITGWIICIIACSVYIMTMEASGSLWDCGEFASSAYKLQIPHPPGAPLFVLIGRLFMAPFGPQNAATGINLMSALSSGFTILFLFWSITHFAKKIALKSSQELTGEQTFGIMAAGVVGSLAYCFSDSFWYSAVEGEVYALSSFFTAIVFWAMLKWENAVTEEQKIGITGHFTGADRWLILIFYLMGLSIGVHLLNLLTIPAMVIIYYFKRYKITTWGTVIAFVVGCTITGIVQKFVIQSTIKVAGNFDIFFVNSLGLPFFVGFAFFFIILFLLIFLSFKLKARYLEAFRRYFDFSGRSSRAEYWSFFFFNVTMQVFIAASSDGNSTNYPLLLYALLTFVPGIAVMVRRMHDVGESGWYGLIPIYNLILALKKGDRGQNKYGGDPQNETGDNSSGFLKLTLWCLSFMLLGYSSYITTLIRSNADTAVDMYNVDNPVSLVGYLSREQYGETPIVTGPDFTAGNVVGEDYQPEYTTVDTYIKTKNGYEKKGRKQTVTYQSQDVHLFPRMWDAGNEQGHANYYASFAGITKDQKTGLWSDKPSFLDNIKFFNQYQVGWMYLRYFMWNFAGKQNDIQGVITNNVRDGNWKTGIGFFDNWRLGDQKVMPDSAKHNKANNSLFALPLILGILGLVFQAKRDSNAAIVVGLLFFFTGLAIVIYLNMPGNMPRERDYAFVGSFYAFAIWIGLGVLYVKELLAKLMSKSIANYLAAAACFAAVPLLMANVEWDDHDRGKKVIARDLAIDYLQSCAPNAILISFGDNDTYPLWYAQEVEGIRRDVRVINSSLLGIDWYINQLRYKVNESDPIDPIWTADQIEGAKRDGVYFVQKPGIDPNVPMDLLTMMKDYAGSDDPSKMEQTRDGIGINTYPAKKLTVPVDSALVRKNGTVNANDTIVAELQIDISARNVLQKNDATILNIIAANKWKRPIYFTNDRVELGFDQYLRQDGMSYRLVPVVNSEVNQEWVVDKMMNKFAFGSADKKGVYFDEENRRHLNSIRLAYASAAINLAETGKKEEAKKMLNKVDKGMLQENFGYGMVSRFQQHNYISSRFLEACYRAGDTALADKVTKSLKKDLEQQMSYYASLGGMSVAELQQNVTKSSQIRYQQERDQFMYNVSPKLQPLYDDAERAYQFLRDIDRLEQFFKNPKPVQIEQGGVINNSTPVDSQPKK